MKKNTLSTLIELAINEDVSSFLLIGV